MGTNDPNTLNHTTTAMTTSNHEQQKRSPRSWDESFLALASYKQTHGCLPKRTGNGDDEAHRLAVWLTTQRERHRKFRLSENQRTMLRSIGVDVDHKHSRFVDPQRREIWDMMFQDLQAYKHRFGNANVPTTYRSLGRWVNWQRLQYRLGHLSQERQAKLNSIKLELTRDSPSEEDQELAASEASGDKTAKTAIYSATNETQPARSHATENNITVTEGDGTKTKATEDATAKEATEEEDTTATAEATVEEGTKKSATGTETSHVVAYDMNYFLTHIYKPLEDEADIDDLLSFSDDIPSLRHCKEFSRKRNKLKKRPVSDIHIATESTSLVEDEEENSFSSCPPPPAKKAHPCEEAETTIDDDDDDDDDDDVDDDDNMYI